MWSNAFRRSLINEYSKLEAKILKPKCQPMWNATEMMSNAIYVVDILQFFQGIAIALLNILVIAATISKSSLQNVHNYLIANLCFSNLLAGVILSVANVVDRSNGDIFLGVKGTIACINSLVNILTLFAAVISHVIALKRSDWLLSSPKTCSKILAGIWIGVALLVLLKALLFSLNASGVTSACFGCFVAFEVSLLLITGLATFSAFGLVAWRRQKSTKLRPILSHDVPTGALLSGSDKLRYAVSIESRQFWTLGVLLTIFEISFLIFVFLYLVYAAWVTIDSTVSAILLIVYFLHAILTPTVVITRDTAMRDTVRQIAKCRSSLATNLQQTSAANTTTVSGNESSEMTKREHDQTVTNSARVPSAPPWSPTGRSVSHPFVIGDMNDVNSPLIGQNHFESTASPIPDVVPPLANHLYA